ncbi:Sigma factor AlgU regulatory protein MucB [Methylophilaceae bacterium]|nr:Sigma factor AlgU regulatory protein MucB [Methylophilaceae bacterium]
MKRLLLACLLAGPMSLAVANPEAEDDPWLVLEKAAHAARDLSYKGVFTYQSGDNSRSIEITHMNSGQGEYARVIMLDGLPREVLSQGSDIVIFSPRNEKVVIEKRRGKNLFPALLPVNLDLIKASYQARMSGKERVAGREGLIVHLEPRDSYRYSYKLLTDREFGLLLKATTLNQRNEVIEQIAFNQLNLLIVQDMEWFQPKVDPRKPYVMEEEVPESAATDSGSWKVGQLPLGYKLIDHIKRMVPGKAIPVNQLIFSDGLSSVSLFIEPLAKGARPKVGHTVMGPTNFYAYVNGGYQIMVVGEVPEATVSQIANSVNFKK